MPLQKPSCRASCSYRLYRHAASYPSARKNITQLQPQQSTSITLHLLFRKAFSAQKSCYCSGFVLLCFGDQWTSEKCKGNLQILKQPKLIFKMVVLCKKRECVMQFPVPAPFPKTQAKQPPKGCVQHVRALPPEKRMKVTPLGQVMEDNGRVEQAEPKLFLNFIIRGIKSLLLLLAVVKINYSIVGKKRAKVT